MDTTEFLDYLAVQHGRTRRILDALPPDRLDFRPDESMRTIGDLIEHIVNIFAFLDKMLVDGEYSAGEPPEKTPTNIEEALARLDEGYKKAKDHIADMPGARWNAELRPFGYPLTAPEAARQVVEHVIHHRGQIHVYAVLLGVKPPYLFAPLDAPLPREL